MPGSADKEQARRDEAAFHLINQYMIFYASFKEEIQTALGGTVTICMTAQVRGRIRTALQITNQIISLGVIDPDSTTGKLLFQYLEKMKLIRNDRDYDLLYVDQLFSKIETFLQKQAAKFTFKNQDRSGKAIEKSLEHSNVYVEDAKVALTKKKEDGEERDEGD